VAVEGNRNLRVQQGARLHCPIARRYPGLPAVRATILANLPGYFVGPERVSFIDELNKRSTVDEAMEQYLVSFGRASLERISP
jgi:hypothetical protein